MTMFTAQASRLLWLHYCGRLGAPQLWRAWYSVETGSLLWRSTNNCFRSLQITVTNHQKSEGACWPQDGGCSFLPMVDFLRAGAFPGLSSFEGFVEAAHNYQYLRTRLPSSPILIWYTSRFWRVTNQQGWTSISAWLWLLKPWLTL